MSAQPTVLQVVILRDGLLVGTEMFVPGQYTLGSGAYSDLKLDDPSVGEAHATLYFQNGKAAVQDQGSVLGVFVNGHRVTACEVRPVDEIAIGPFSLKVRVLAQKPPQKQAPPPELAALLGSPAPAAGAPPAARPPVPAARPAQPPAAAKPVPATVVSTRQRPAVPPAGLETTVPTARSGGNLKPVSSAPFDVEDETMTESLMLGEQQLEQPTTQAPQMNVRPPPPPPMSAPEPPPRPAPAPPKPAAKPVPAAAAPSGAALRKNQAPPPSKPAPVPPAAVAAPARPRKRSLPSIPAAAEGKGAPRLFFELYWGELRQHARSFGAIKPKKPVLGGLDDNAQMPLWGFRLGQPQMVLADKKGGGYRVFVPVGAAVERRGDDGNFYPLTSDQLEAVGQRKFIGLSNGQAVRFSGEGDTSLVAYVQPPLPRPFSNPLKGLPFLALGLQAMFLCLFGAFVSFAPSDDMPDFVPKNVPPVAVRLIKPEEKKKEEAKKKLEEIKKKEPEKKKEVAKKEVEKPVAKPPPLAQPPKIKSLEKLTAAGPAMKDLLAAVDKLGNGPGKKDAKNNYKMADLIGKAPIANAGLGTFGLGGGGAGGMGTKGLEVLRGKGGGGIGALGAGNVGKGAVGGTVGRASVRSIGVQGTIDKEAVAKVINSHLAEVSACYERALLREPGLAGKIVLEWNISTSGTVTTAKTKSSTMKSSAVEGCILNSLKTWKFPPAKGAGVVISYPFLFNSVGY